VTACVTPCFRQGPGFRPCEKKGRPGLPSRGRAGIFVLGFNPCGRFGGHMRSTMQFTFCALLVLGVAGCSRGRREEGDRRRADGGQQSRRERGAGGSKSCRQDRSRRQGKSKEGRERRSRSSGVDDERKSQSSQASSVESARSRKETCPTSPGRRQESRC